MCSGVFGFVVSRYSATEISSRFVEYLDTKFLEALLLGVAVFVCGVHCN